MFPGATGDYLDGSALRRRYATALNRAGLRPLRFHDPRHTFGTRMIAKADIRARVDLLDGLRRIGIDEISHRKGQRYLTVVVDHDTGRLVWAAPAATARQCSRSLISSGKSAAKPWS